MLDELGKVIVGQQEVLEQILVTLFCRGHALVIGVPGLAKTLIVRSLARCMALDFKRIQFTPDLMPSDITGTEVLEIDPETQRRSFRFVAGPIFTNILLADEINRTPPKTQAALLEAMQEYAVTVGGVTHAISPPFFVLATQNPIELEGTYPLPEAQLDRFMLNVLISYPARDEEIRIFRTTTIDELPEPTAVMDGRQILHVQRIVRRMPVSDHVLEYVASLARATRPECEEAPPYVKQYVEWGAGPRAGQYLVLGAKALALIDGRFNVSCSDVRDVAHPVLRHRIFTNFNADSEGVSVEDVIDHLLDTIQEPDEQAYARKARRRRAGRPAVPEDEETDL
ncbi:MAG: AAA family ATPase [Planctomycetes bacterium SM23_32]|nr:MAG: AAA family ATPase [Planctomycetes bacterium SM23_32]